MGRMYLECKALLSFLINVESGICRYLGSWADHSSERYDNKSR